jgi:hypothetical protein
MDTSTPKVERRRGVSSPGADALSWALLVLGLLGFVPCVLFPEWLAYRWMSIAELEERQRLIAMEHQVAREADTLEAIQADPEVVARLAQRELNFTPVGGFTVEVAVPADSTLGRTSRFFDSVDHHALTPRTGAALSDEVRIEPPQLPLLIRRWIGWLPAYPYERVFAENFTRGVIMVMSVAVLGVALWMGEAGRRGSDRSQMFR